ncbi:MAG: hypothetical protein SXV54_05735 [Chloroflexota bacterium]|nr:hypothetical protein [Chloroflexota bacterium]
MYLLLLDLTIQAERDFATGYFLPNALIPDAATCCGGLVAQTNSANQIFVGQKRQQVGASVKVSGSESEMRGLALEKPGFSEKTWFLTT